MYLTHSAVRRYGGIYVDVDAVALRPFGPVFRRSVLTTKVRYYKTDMQNIKKQILNKVFVLLNTIYVVHGYSQFLTKNHKIHIFFFHLQQLRLLSGFKATF